MLASSDLADATPSPAGSQTPHASHPIEIRSPQGFTSVPAHAPVLLEAVPNNADGFNWQEDNISVDGLTDGMAALSVEPTGVGYLGNTLYHQINSKS